MTRKHLSLAQLMEKGERNENVDRTQVSPPLRAERPLRALMATLERILVMPPTPQDRPAPFAVGDRVFAVPTHANNLAANIHHYYGHVVRTWPSVIDETPWVGVSLVGRAHNLPVENHILDGTEDRSDYYPFREDEIAHLD